MHQHSEEDISYACATEIVAGLVADAIDREHTDQYQRTEGHGGDAGVTDIASSDAKPVRASPPEREDQGIGGIGTTGRHRRVLRKGVL